MTNTGTQAAPATGNDPDETRAVGMTTASPDGEQLGRRRIPCRTLELVDAGPTYSREQLARIGISGIQFGSGIQRHPSCLNTDAMGLVASQADEPGGEVTTPGAIYRVDDESYFVQLDVRRRLPFRSGSLQWVYAEHLIEHLTLDDGVGWLREVRRILAPGGLFRVTTPDLRRYAEGYLTDDGFFEEHHRRLVTFAGGAEVPSRKAFLMNQIFMFWGHRWLYDFDELRYALVTAGFSTDAVVARGFRDGALPDVAAFDREIRSDETIYVEVVVDHS